MEQQTRIASLLKEVDELRNRLTQVEERELSQKEMNQRLKETTEMEVLKLLIKQCALILYPDLLSSKPQVRSSQVNILATGSRTKDGCPPTRPLINFKTKLSPREYAFSRREGGRGRWRVYQNLMAIRILLSPEANSVKHLSYTVQNIKNKKIMTSVLYTLLICRFPL